jgi:DNA polymerase-1
MLEAFKSGGDFHSRTAVGMYAHIRKEVEAGTVLVDWDTSKGKPPVPLVKDKFATERRRAKTLNFSIAYGKTVHGFAKDWNVSTTEAQETLDKWYADRPEVRLWQQRMIAYAHETGFTRTLLGRYRRLPDINSENKRFVRHSERAAINTPLQGGAADVVICAMLKLHRSDKLKSLGWKQLLQIHDELILEGPEETKAEALQLIRALMENALENPLLVELVVDAKTEKDWYSAK